MTHVKQDIQKSLRKPCHGKWSVFDHGKCAIEEKNISFCQVPVWKQLSHFLLNWDCCKKGDLQNNLIKKMFK